MNSVFLKTVISVKIVQTNNKEMKIPVLFIEYIVLMAFAKPVCMNRLLTASR